MGLSCCCSPEMSDSGGCDDAVSQISQISREDRAQGGAHFFLLLWRGKKTTNVAGPINQKKLTRGRGAVFAFSQKTLASVACTLFWRARRRRAKQKESYPFSVRFS